MINFPLMNKLSFFLAFLLAAVSVNAQQTADKIVAVVGKNRIVLASDIEAQALQMKQQDPASYSDAAKCQILQQMILQKMLVEQAARDSVVVGNEEVDATLDNRIRYFVSLYGSKEKLEEASGKTIYQLKEDNRETIRETMLAEKMQGQILQHVKVTPAEVQAFYSKIPVDSLPFFPAMVEMGQIVIDPPVSPELEQYAREKLEDIRNQIVKDGKDFETMAGLYSQDPGSRNNGGDLGTVNRKSVVPEFAAAAFKLQNGEISQIVKTKFGYHIIQMVRRQGEDAHLRHILIKAEHTSADYQKALTKLDSVRAELITGKITFPEAVGKYSTDDMSNRTGGMIADPQTGSTQLEIDKLDPALALMTDTLKQGSYSQPQVYDAGKGEKSCRIVYMKSITTPHKANLKDDYARIQEVALQQKKNGEMNKWVAEKAPGYYMKIDPEYRDCEEIKKWVTETAKK
jgi:peptidyl-prolyl cis-trans isomerase SurA